MGLYTGLGINVHLTYKQIGCLKVALKAQGPAVLQEEYVKLFTYLDSAANAIEHNTLEHTAVKDTFGVPVPKDLTKVL